MLAYLTVPVLLGLAMFVHGVTRAPDRVQLATVCLFICAAMYAAAAYGVGAQMKVAGIALAAYAAVAYAAAGALGIFFAKWAWWVALLVFALHGVAGLFGIPTALELGAQGIAVLVVSLAVGAIGVYALLHRGTRAVLARRPAPA